jgi:hypothetical protein
MNCLLENNTKSPSIGVPPNKACSRQVGLAAFYNYFSTLRVLSAPKQSPRLVVELAETQRR